MILRTAALALLSAMSLNAMAASFDCAKASNFAEREICRDSYLSSLDEMLSQAYREAQQVAIDQNELRSTQRAWMQARNACTAQQCLDASISGRITELKQFVRDQNEKASIAKYEAEQAQMAADAAARQAAVDEMAATEAAVNEELARQAAQLEAMNQQLAQEQAAAEAQAQTAAPAPVPPPVQEEVAEVADDQTLDDYRDLAPAPAVTPEPQPYTDSETYTTATQPAGKSWLSFFIEGNAWKYSLLSLVAIVGLAMFLHHGGTLTVYLNYTDALVTNALPAAGMVFWALLAWLDVPDPIPNMVFKASVLLAMAFGLISSIQSNDSAWKIVVSFGAKVVLIGVFYLVMAFLVISMLGANTKYKGETRAQADARNRRTAREVKASIAGASVGYTLLTGWLCRYGEFSPIAECLSPGGEPEEA